MWDGLFLLLGLSTVMAVASYLAGSLPLTITLKARHMRLITACGTGVLVGTSLIVIIPEGVETLYSAVPSSAKHTRRAEPILASWSGPVQGVDVGSDEKEAGGRDFTVYIRQTQEEDDMRSSQAQEGRPSSDEVSAPADKGAIPEPEKAPAHDAHDDHDFEPHAWIGLALIVGFVLMYLIDRLPLIASTSSQPRRSYISLDRIGLHSSSSDPSEADQDEDHSVSGSGSRPSSTTVGLVIHAAADGIALGASTTSSSKKLGFVVFLALMIHKAPAAFGLTAVLLKQGLSKRRARMHLLIFSLAAPAGALATWSAAQVIGGPRLGQDMNTSFATGMLLLFSGGTFLYVAMHTMQEGGGHDHSHANGSAQDGYADPYQQEAQKEEGPSLLDALATVGGMLLPLFTQIGHAH